MLAFSVHCGEANEVGASGDESADLDFFSMMPAMPDEIEVEHDGDAQYDAEEKLIFLDGNVVIKGDTGLIMYADQAVIDTEEQKVTATQNVSVFNGPLLYHGEEAIYYYQEQKLDTKGTKTGSGPYLLEADQMKTVERDGVKVLVAEKAKVTTDDYQKPSFYLNAEKLSIYPNEMVIFKGLNVEVGGRTIFWLPFLAQSVDKDVGYHFKPGIESHLGFFWKNRYGIELGGERDPDTMRMKDPKYILQAHVDPYLRRGLGMGADLIDLNYRTDAELGLYSLYWIFDFDPQIERTNVSRANFDQELRYRMQVKHRQDLGELLGGTTRADVNLTWLSDRFLLEDYFERDFFVEHEPDNVLSLTHQRERSVANLHTRLQLNSFYETDLRLPELALDYTRGSLLDTSLLYESQTSFGFYRRALSEQQIDILTNALPSASATRQDEIRAELAQNGYFRAHSWHEVSRPILIQNGVSITPRAGAGYSYYDDEDQSYNRGRWMAFFGVDFAMKMSRDYHHIQNDWLGIDGIGHRIQPYVSLSVFDVNGPTFRTRQAVDTLTPLTRPRPIHVGRYSAIDQLESWEFIRMGTRQTFLTKRNGDSFEWLYMDTYIDVLLGDEDNANSLSNLYNELIWRPLPWLSVNLETQFPVGDEREGDFTEFYGSTTFMLGRSTRLNVGVNYLDDHPLVEDIRSVNYSIYHRINDKWGLGMEHHWRLDRDLLGYQAYTIDRNLKSWIFTTELYRRDYLVRDEWGITFGFTLRDFPDISLPLTVNRQ